MKSWAGIYIGWVGHQNLGDEAIWEVCRKTFWWIHWTASQQALQELNYRRLLGSRMPRNARSVRRLLSEISDPHNFRLLADRAIHCVARQFDTEVGILGGGTLLNRADSLLDAYRSLTKRTNRLVPVFGTGVESPEFWSSKPGWTDRRREWVSVLADLPAVGVRGPISKHLLEEAGANNVRVVGDPAIRFHRRLDGNNLDNNVGRKLRIGINWGGLEGEMWGNMTSLEAAVVPVIQELYRSGHDIQILPVWPEDLVYCYDLAKQAGIDRSAVSEVLARPRDFIRKVKILDLVISLKLHAGILSAAANTPVITLEYQPKCLDFAASLQWEEFNIRTSDVTKTRLMDMVADMTGRLPALRMRLCRSACTLSNQFSEYCGMVAAMLRDQIAIRMRRN